MQRFMIAVFCAAVFTASATSFSVGQPPSPEAIYKESAARLAFIKARGGEAAGLAVAAARGQGPAAAALAQRLGGKVRYRADQIDYLSVDLPVDSVAAFVASPAVHAVTIDQPEGFQPWYSGWSNPTGGSVGDARKRVQSGERNGTPEQDRGTALSSVGPNPDWWPQPNAHPLENPHNILKDMDGHALRADQPTYDGRGVVIAHVEVGSADFLAPEMQVGYDLNGNRVPKFVDVVSVPSFNASLTADRTPVQEGRDWFRLGKAMNASDRVTFKGQHYRVPGKGTYRLAEFTIDGGSLFAAMKKAYPPETDVEDGRKRAVIARAMLWSDSDQTLRVDFNNDRDFRNDTPVQPYAVSRHFGVIGVDDPETGIRETVGYALQKEDNHVALNMGTSGHASMVAGAAAASRADTGLLDGVAPGAQLLSINFGASVTAFSQSLVMAFADPRTDVILVQMYAGVDQLHNLKNGRSTLAVVQQRLVERYGKPVFITADNNPGMSTIFDAGNGGDVISVGAYQSSAAVFAHNGAKTKYADNLHWVGAEGPSGDGALKPDFLAPANPVTIDARHVPSYGSALDSVFKLPSGYGIGGGTSTATPVATGAAAVLVSAAKQVGIKWDAFSINRALRSTARFLPRFPAYKQGHGLIQIGAAWRAMQAEARGAPVITVEVAAPLSTVTSAIAPKPDQGRGLFEREGWSVGDERERTIMLTRTSGPAGELLFDVEWVGNAAGTFASAPTIILPLNAPTPFRVRVAPKQAGDHSALARLRHSDVPGAVVAVPITIVAPHELTASNDYAQNISVSVDRPGRKNLFVRVPEGSTILNFAVSTSRDSLSSTLLGPDNREQSLPDMTGNGSASVVDPLPGVWTVVLNESGDSTTPDWTVRDQDYLPPVTADVRVSVSGVDLGMPAKMKAGGSVPITLTNRLDSFTGRTSGAIGALRRKDGVLGRHHTQLFDLTVEDGTSLLIAEIETAAAGADFDLYLFDCTGGSCKPARYGTAYASGERVLMENPLPGSWKALVKLHGGNVDQAPFSYRDIIVHPRFGGVLTTDALKLRGSGEVWQVTAHAWLAEATPRMRTPMALLMVTDPSRREWHMKTNWPDGKVRGLADLYETDMAPLVLKMAPVE